MEPNLDRIREVGAGLNQRVLEIAQKVDDHDAEAIDMYAGEITMEFCRAGFRGIAAGLIAASSGANDEAITKAFEEMMPQLPFYRECFQGVRTQILDAMKALVKNPN